MDIRKLEYVFSDPSNNSLRWGYEPIEQRYVCYNVKDKKVAGSILGQFIVSPERTTIMGAVSQLRRMLWNDWSKRNG